MMLPLEASATMQRYEDMLREAEQIHLANKVAAANGAQSLLSRMVKLLSRSSRPSVQTTESLAQHRLAEAKL